MRTGYLSQKSVWTVIGVVVILLILAATILSKATFKADSPSLSVFLDPPSTTLAVNEQVIVAVKVQSNTSTIISAVQVALGFDDNNLELTGAIAGQGYQTKKFVNQDGEIYWAIIPDSQISVASGQNLEIGTMKFTAKKAGASQLVFNQSQTIIAALDPTSSPSLRNGLSSIQNAILTVSGENASPVDLPLVQQSSTLQAISNIVSSQRTKKIEVAPAYDSALVMTDLLYKGRLSINFGETEKLGTTVQPTGVSSTHGVKLMGLKPATRYYYQVSIISEDGTNQINASVKSFTTYSGLANGGEVASLEMFAYPDSTKDISTLYILPKDKDGQLVSGASLNLSVLQGKASLTSLAESNGLYQATITTQLSSRQTVRIQASANGSVVSETSLTFDPNYIENSEPVEAETPYLTMNQKVVMWLAALIAGFLALGLLFVKLAKLK